MYWLKKSYYVCIVKYCRIWGLKFAVYSYILTQKIRPQFMFWKTDLKRQEEKVFYCPAQNVHTASQKALPIVKWTHGLYKGKIYFHLPTWNYNHLKVEIKYYKTNLHSFISQMTPTVFLAMLKVFPGHFSVWELASNILLNVVVNLSARSSSCITHEI